MATEDLPSVHSLDLTHQFVPLGFEFVEALLEDLRTGTRYGLAQTIDAQGVAGRLGERNRHHAQHFHCSDGANQVVNHAREHTILEEIGRAHV